MKFLSSRKDIDKVTDGVQTYIEYIESNNDVVLRRTLISLKSFFEKKKKLFDKIIFTSATLPDKDFLSIDFGNNVSILKSESKPGERKGIVYLAKQFNLDYASIKNDFERKVYALLDLIFKIKQKSIVVFYKSYSIINNVERRNILEKKFKENAIPLFIIRDNKAEKHNEIWNDFYIASRRKKAVMMCSAFGKYGRSSNNLEGDKCRVLIIWGIPREREPTIDKKLRPIIHRFYNDFFTKNKLPYTFNQFWYCLKPRRILQQNIGRLVRNSNDHGFFILCMDRDIESILPKSIRDDLDILRWTTQPNEVIDAMNSFFDQVNNG